MLTVTCSFTKRPVELRKVEIQRSELIISLYYCSGHENLFNFDVCIIKELKAEESSDRRYKSDRKDGHVRDS